MAYKIVNVEQLEADLTSVADSIRAKAGTSGKLDFPAGFKSAVDSIANSGSTSNIPSAATAMFGRNLTTESTPSGKAYYNGILLPEIPVYTNGDYVYYYAWIRTITDADTGKNYYVLYTAANVWVYNTSYATLYSNSTVPCYRIETADADIAVEWEFYGELSASDVGKGLSIGDGTSLVWSSHAILYEGSSTDVYFEGTDPITEVISNNGYGDFADCAESYTVLGETLNEIAYRLQIKNNIYGLLTGAQVRDYILALAEIGV